MTGASSMRTRGYERSGVQHYRAKSRRAPGSDMPIVLRACVSARKEMRGVEALAARPARVEHALVAAAGRRARELVVGRERVLPQGLRR